MTIHIINSFSFNMIKGPSATVTMRWITAAEASEIARNVEVSSAVGHPDTAGLFSEQLGVPVPMNRVSLSVGAGATLLLGQMSGPRLPEGTTVLPPGASIQWMLVNVFE